MNILNKLGIANTIPYKQCNNVKPSEANLFAALRKKDLKKLSHDFSELLEALIDMCRQLIDIGYQPNIKNENHPIRVVEKVTGLKWEEIKAIYDKK